MDIDGITLSDQFVWENEFTYNQVAQFQDRSVTGALLVQEQAKSYGREIELVGGADAVWVTRTELLALKAKEALVDHSFAVTLPGGQQFTCRFNRVAGPAIQAERVTRYGGVPASETLYFIARIRLITVEP